MVRWSGEGRICWTSSPAGIRGKRRLGKDDFRRGATFLLCAHAAPERRPRGTETAGEPNSGRLASARRSDDRQFRSGGSCPAQAGASRCSLRAWKRGDVAVTDSLAAHEVAGVCAAISSMLCLLPDSPDCNLIEQLFAKLKALLR